MVTIIDKHTALVLIDLQNGILQMPMADTIAGVLTNVAKLVAAFRVAGLPIIFVNVDPSGPFIRIRKDANPPVLPRNDDWLNITSDIDTRPGDIYITKPSWNAFYNTKIDEELTQRNITGIVLAGVSTSIGVEGTARSAAERGYNITFASDAMTDMVAESQERSLKYIFPRLGQVDLTEKIIEVLEKTQLYL